MPEAPPQELAPHRVTRKRFALDEANRSLAYVRKVVGDITDQYADIVTMRRNLPGPEDAQELRTDEQAEAVYEAAMDRLGGLVDELHDTGVELRDFERGVVAFPADYGGRTILLSWQPGEPAVTHYHEQDESITQRRTLDFLDAAAA